jgi:hypothetical protein
VETVAAPALAAHDNAAAVEIGARLDVIDDRRDHALGAGPHRTGASAIRGLSTAMAAIPCGRNPRAWIATESFQLPPILTVTGGRAAPAGFRSQNLMSRPSNGIDSGSRGWRHQPFIGRERGLGLGIALDLRRGHHRPAADRDRVEPPDREVRRRWYRSIQSLRFDVVDRRTSRTWKCRSTKRQSICPLAYHGRPARRAKVAS